MITIIEMISLLYIIFSVDVFATQLNSLQLFFGQLHESVFLTILAMVSYFKIYFRKEKKKKLSHGAKILLILQAFNCKTNRGLSLEAGHT